MLMLKDRCRSSTLSLLILTTVTIFESFLTCFVVVAADIDFISDT